MEAESDRELNGGDKTQNSRCEKQNVDSALCILPTPSDCIFSSFMSLSGIQVTDAPWEQTSRYKGWQAQGMRPLGGSPGT